MAYIYKKTVHKKPYYYLRISKKIGKKTVTKDVAYLGSSIENILPQLDKIPSKYKSSIRKSYKNISKFIETNHYLQKVKEKKIKSDKFIERELLEQIEAIKMHFNEYFLKLDEKTKMETYKNFLIDFAFNTTSIEGNTITLKEAEKLLKENLTPKEKSIREVFDLQNTEKVFFELLGKKEKLNEQLVIKVHDDLLKNIDERTGYRLHEIRVFRSHFDASPFKFIKIDMKILFEWHSKNKKKLHPFALAVLFHQKFEKIHPFSDGNGRTGRAILNYILQLNGFPPLIVSKKNRAEYLKSLAQADKSDISGIEPKHYKKLIEFAAKEYQKSYWDNFNI